MCHSSSGLQIKLLESSPAPTSPRTFHRWKSPQTSVTGGFKINRRRKTKVKQQTQVCGGNSPPNHDKTHNIQELKGLCSSPFHFL